MCGIFGIVGDSARLAPATLARAAPALFRLSETRGKESAGAALARAGSLRFLKAATSPQRFIRSAAFKKFMAEERAALAAQPGAFALIGHSRLVTNGGQHLHANNQPVRAGGFVAVHNGIIVNDAALWAAHPALTRDSDVDTEALLKVLGAALGPGGDLADAARAAFGTIVGTASVAAISETRDALLLATNNGSLYVALNAEDGVLTFASERRILADFLAAHLSETGAIVQIAADAGLIVDLATLKARPFSFVGAEQVETRSTQRTIEDATPAAERQAGANSMPAAPSGAGLARFEIDMAPIRALKRCSACILPETVPFIAFDAAGVCNFCRTHTPHRLRGRPALETAAAALAPGARSQANCLFTLSGGRDSSFGLHFAVRELGHKPAAYTYDWGMITDLARRNQARMCGALKVEHIIVSADIAAKRANIRKNLIAWLKQPDLGLIPLLMAGDKHYFYYANQVSRDLGVQTTVLASNPFERTHFKAGFCGVAPSAGHRPSMGARGRMAAHYAAQFARNPGYLNASLFDTASAFGSYYFIAHDYLRLFDYIAWDESEINTILRDLYDWETAPDTASTWRIGDGTAAFYNYAYLKLAGFTENDSFRSNQIRAGLLSRDAALALSEAENAPRFDSIAWYCAVVGIDAAEALAQLARAPTLYGRA